MQFSETMAVATFLLATVGVMFVVVLVAIRRTGTQTWDLGSLQAELHEVQEGLKDVREELQLVHERLPRRIDNQYDLVRKVGTGGVGEVWEATDSSTGDRVAIKLLRKKFTEDDHTRRRFIREAHVAKHLQHPNVVQTVAAGEDASGQLYLVMELLDGRTLRDLLEHSPGGLPIWEVVRVGLSMCEALIAASEFGIVHRDIKPENICAPAGGPYQLADFGLGYITSGEADASRMTDEGVISGTPHYMSPEQCRGGLNITASTDIYSLGCVLYEAATGRPPFNESSLQGLLIAHCDRPRPGISKYPLLSALVGQMLSIDPESRPSPEQVISALEALEDRAEDTL